LNVWVPKMISTSSKMIQVLFFYGRNRRNAQRARDMPVELFLESIKKQAEKK
jgi:hypothetical protein